VEANLFRDNTDVALIVGNAPGASIRGNRIVQERETAFAGLMLDNFGGTQCGDFRGAVVRDNTRPLRKLSPSAVLLRNPVRATSLVPLVRPRSPVRKSGVGGREPEGRDGKRKLGRGRGPGDRRRRSRLPLVPASDLRQQRQWIRCQFRLSRVRSQNDLLAQRDAFSRLEGRSSPRRRQSRSYDLYRGAVPRLRRTVRCFNESGAGRRRRRAVLRNGESAHRLRWHELPRSRRDSPELQLGFRGRISGLRSRSEHRYIDDAVYVATLKVMDNAGIVATASTTVDIAPRNQPRVSVTLGGAGSVTSSPAGIDCGADCSENYGLGTVVSLSASPAAGWGFAGWGGDCTGAPNPCLVTMDRARSVSALFELLPTYLLSVTVAERAR